MAISSELPIYHLGYWVLPYPNRALLHSLLSLKTTHGRVVRVRKYKQGDGRGQKNKHKGYGIVTLVPSHLRKITLWA